MVRSIKLELCDSDNSILAVEYLDIDDISDYKDRYLLPTIGPCYIDFYSEPYQSRTKKGFYLNFEKTKKIQLANLNIDKVLSINDRYTNNEYIPVNSEQQSGGKHFIFFNNIFIGLSFK